MVRYFHDAVTSDPEFSQGVLFVGTHRLLPKRWLSRTLPGQFGKPTVEQPRDYSKLPFVEPASSETADSMSHASHRTYRFRAAEGSKDD